MIRFYSILYLADTINVIEFYLKAAKTRFKLIQLFATFINFLINFRHFIVIEYLSLILPSVFVTIVVLY